MTAVALLLALMNLGPVTNATTPTDQAPVEVEVDELSRSVAVVQTTDGHGTGFLVDERTVMTAAHVAPSGSVRVVFGDSTISGDVVATDTANDLALVSLAGSPGANPLSIATEPPALGEDVLAIGAPTGSITVTRGIVSAVFDNGEIQTDASVNPGNSGGPLMRASGEVLGVVTMKANAEGIGYATGSEAMHELLGSSEDRPSEDGSSGAPAPAPSSPEVSPPDGATPGSTVPGGGSLSDNSSGTLLIPLGVSAGVVLAAITLLALRHRRSRPTSAQDDFEVRLGPAQNRPGG